VQHIADLRSFGGCRVWTVGVQSAVRIGHGAISSCVAIQQLSHLHVGVRMLDLSASCGSGLSHGCDRGFTLHGFLRVVGQFCGEQFLNRVFADQFVAYMLSLSGVRPIGTDALDEASDAEKTIVFTERSNSGAANGQGYYYGKRQDLLRWHRGLLRSSSCLWHSLMSCHYVGDCSLACL